MAAPTSITLRREPGAFVRSLTALLLRASLGMIFLTAGLGKYFSMNQSVDNTAVDPVVEIVEDDSMSEEPEPVSPPPPLNGEAVDDEAATESTVTDSEQPAGYPDSLRAGFKDTFLETEMAWALDLFFLALPFVEIAVGALLILGLLTSLTGFATGLLLLGLLFGHLVTNNIAMWPSMLIYLMTNAGILWLSPVTSNYISLDGLLFGWFWAPKPEGQYRAEDETSRKS